jgi:hypothetical protein
MLEGKIQMWCGQAGMPAALRREGSGQVHQRCLGMRRKHIVLFVVVRK